ncbi:MAG: riboflavin biosynthesis protein RibD [Pseudomonadota bacterium]
MTTAIAPGADDHMTLDGQRLAQALALATQAIGLSEPNPRVGCVIADAQGRMVGEGHTQRVGGPHAEVMALRAARAAAGDAALRGGTAWVTLEPCAHHGRTPPCADALIAAGLARVVIAMRDPFPQVAGRGIARLRDAGITVVEAPPDSDLCRQAQDLNIGFFSRIERGRPWVRMKIAGSLDGHTASPDGRSQWITSMEARNDGHAWRRRATAVLTGLGTVLADDPLLDVRALATDVQPWPLVLDSRWQCPPGARLLARADCCIAGLDDAALADDDEARVRREKLRAAGVRLIELPAAGQPTPAHASAAMPHAHHTDRPRPDLGALMRTLAASPVNELHVEAGAMLNGSLLAGGWVDELLIYMAPRWLGEGRGLAALAPDPQSLAAQPAWHWEAIDRIGSDVRLRLRRTQP